MTESDKPEPTVDDDVSNLSYGEALVELEELLTELEHADVDVDQLSNRVARGAQLVRHCQQRLAVVSGEVDSVVNNLAEADGDQPHAGSTEAESTGAESVETGSVETGSAATG